MRKFDSLLPLLRDHFLQRVENFHAGQLSEKLYVWETLTSDREILSLIKGAEISFIDKPVQMSVHQNLSLEDQGIIAEEIRSLMKKGVVVRSSPEADQIISPIFVTTKKDGGHRMILNLKYLNENIEYQHFKMEMLHNAIRMMTQDCFMASIDFKDAYYSVPIHVHFQKYLKFKFNGELFCYTAFPNGLAPCPRLFTKLMKPVMAELRKRGVMITGFIDDSFVVDADKVSCINSVIETVSLVDQLGFVVHPDKSVLQPTQEITYLGFILNSKTMTVSLTKDKAKGIRKECKTLSGKTSPTIREVAQVVGKLVASLPAVLFGPLFYRQIEIDKASALKAARGNYEADMTLSPVALGDLAWWIANIMLVSKPIVTPPPDLIMHTDAASTVGWGATLNKLSCGGAWSASEKEHHINFLELKAVFLALQSWDKIVLQKHVRVMIDNQTAVAAINHMGSCHSKDVDAMAREIWLWCKDKEIWLSAAHIAGSKNVEADYLSRSVDFSIEWKLNEGKLAIALSILGAKPSIDLFASRLNYQFPCYVSYKPDPGSYAVDAFMLDWQDLHFYAFPPFAVIHRVLEKIQRDRARGVIVVPDWPSRSWYSVVARLCTGSPVLLRPATQLLQLTSHPDQRHALHHKLALLVCQVSGKICEHEDFRRLLQSSTWGHGVHQQRSSTNPTSISGRHFVVKGVKIPFLLP